MIVIVIVLSRGYDRGVDIRVSYARTGCLVDMVTREYHMRDGTSTWIWLQESTLCMDFGLVPVLVWVCFAIMIMLCDHGQVMISLL